MYSDCISSRCGCDESLLAPIPEPVAGDDTQHRHFHSELCVQSRWHTDDVSSTGPAFRILNLRPPSICFIRAASHNRTAGHDGTCKIIAFPSGEFLATLEGHKAPVYNAAWSSTGGVLASCSHDNTVILWDHRTYQALSHAHHFP